MKRLRQQRNKSFEEKFPSPAGRAAADAVVVKLDPALRMADYIQAWESEYFRVTGQSPWRK